eukprot:9467917-Pyramimonas_sp.AAC.1
MSYETPDARPLRGYKGVTLPRFECGALLGTHHDALLARQLGHPARLLPVAADGPLRADAVALGAYARGPAALACRAAGVAVPHASPVGHAAHEHDHVRLLDFERAQRARQVAPAARDLCVTAQGKKGWGLSVRWRGARPMGEGRRARGKEGNTRTGEEGRTSSPSRLSGPSTGCTRSRSAIFAAALGNRWSVTHVRVAFGMSSLIRRICRRSG